MSKYLVFGHKNPDTDTISSAIAFSFFLEKIGHQAEAVALGEPNEETAYALNYFNVEAPRVVTTVANEVEAVALVDHNEATQSVDDLQDVRVDYVVDHHRIANFETSEPLFYRAEAIGSTASVLYKIFREHNIDIPKAIAGLMLSAIISDTLLFKSPTSTKQDKEIAYELAKISEVNIESYGFEMLKAGTNLSDKTAEELINGDAKNFDMNNHMVRIGQINSVGFDEILARKEELMAAMQTEVNVNNYSLFIVCATDILDNNSMAYVIGDHQSAVEKAFKQPIIDGQVNLPGIMSRKKQVVPPLTEAFE